MASYGGNIKADNIAEAARIAEQIAATFATQYSENSLGAAMRTANYAAHIVKRKLIDAEGIAHDAASATKYAVQTIALADAEAAEIKLKAVIRKRERTVEWHNLYIAASAAAHTLRSAAYYETEEAFEEGYDSMREIALQWLNIDGNPNQSQSSQFIPNRA